MSVPICKPLTALELLFQTRLLRTAQESVWAVRHEDMHDVSSCLDAIHRRLLLLSSNVHEALYAGLRSRIEDRHDAAAYYAGTIRAELVAEVGSEEAATRLFPARLREKAHVWRVWQEQDWQEMCLLVRKAVEHDARLAAWGEIGFALADVLCRGAAGEAPEAIGGHPWDALQRAVRKLPETERLWAAGFLPRTPPLEPILLGQVVQNAYDDLCQSLPTFDQGRTRKKLPNRVEIPDDDEANFLVKRYLGTHPKATIREVAEKVKCSTGRVSQLEAWRQWMDKKNAAKPPPKRSERRLTNKMQAAIGRHDDPAARLIEAEEHEAIKQWILETATPDQRASYHTIGPDRWAELIKLSRDQYRMEHPEPD